jgi:hypothetical protein
LTGPPQPLTVIVRPPRAFVYFHRGCTFTVAAEGYTGAIIREARGPRSDYLIDLVSRFRTHIGNRYAARSITLRANYRQDTATRSLRHMKT